MDVDRYGHRQHRAQITAEWIDVVTGEVSRGRVRPADRAGVRRFLVRFAGQQLEVALEATTGWRFLVEELRAAGAVVHLAEPAETAALRGNKKRAKSDRADARHLRELLLAGRVPESWIASDHILDLRAQVRLRHTLVEQHTEWQQRIQAVLYHHGCPRRRGLMVADGRDWLAAQSLPEAAREQITVALAMIDALELQLAPLSRELRLYARAQTGCKALIKAYYRDRGAVRGHDPRRAGRLPAVCQLQGCGPLRRDGYHCLSIRSPPCARASRARARQRCAGRCMRPRRSLADQARLIAPTTSRPPNTWAATAPVWRWRASFSSAAITRCASSATTP